MKSYETWMAQYSISHQNPTNKWIHRICVPLIMVSAIGAISLLRLPNFDDSPFLSIAMPIWIGCMIFYARLGWKPFLLMFLQWSLSLLLLHWFERQVSQPFIWYLAIFALAWVGQAIGHWIEGKKPSFLKDLQFLLIGPLWILKK